MKTAVVLGASTGVGAAIVRALSGIGYQVVGFHRGNHWDEALALERETGALTVERDAGESSQAVRDCIAVLNEQPIKVLVHSLAGASVGSMLDISDHGIERTFNNLAHSFLWWVRELWRLHLLEHNARLIALSNPCPDFYLRNSGVIGAAKAALESYVKTLAVELGPERHVDGQSVPSAHRVNAIRFSTVLTPALLKVIPTAQRAAFEQVNRAIMPAGRMTTAEDVARTVSALVSNEMFFANGSVVDLTGGAPYCLMDYVFNGPR